MGSSLTRSVSTKLNYVQHGLMIIKPISMNISAMETLIEVVKFYEANYPETLARCIIINSKSIETLNFLSIISSCEH